MNKELLKTLIEAHAALYDTPELQNKLREAIVNEFPDDNKLTPGKIREIVAPLKPVENPQKFPQFPQYFWDYPGQKPWVEQSRPTFGYRGDPNYFICTSPISKHEFSVQNGVK